MRRGINHITIQLEKQSHRARCSIAQNDLSTHTRTLTRTYMHAHTHTHACIHQ